MAPVRHKVETMTIDQIMHANAQAGQFFFSPDTLRFFASRVSRRTYVAPDGTTYFVTSERFRSIAHGDGPRRYTVRSTTDGAQIDTIGAFQGYRTSGAAHARARYLATGK